MENKLISQLNRVLPTGMHIPEELALLYQWIEDNNLYEDSDECRYGFLFPKKELTESWTDEGREGGTDITFYSKTDTQLYWFVDINEIPVSRLCIFAKTGADGSVCALWQADDGTIKVVHMGSGSGSTLFCVLADNMVDFIRLLAIGYDEICWDEYFSMSPTEIKDFVVKPNLKFQNWVKDTFKVEIPKTALEIIKYPATMDDEYSEDEFFNWYQQYLV